MVAEVKTLAGIIFCCIALQWTGCTSEPPSPPAESELVGSVMARRAEVVDSLLQAGAAPNSRDEEGTPVLILAVNAGQTEVVKKLVEAGADINARREAYFKSTALMEAGVRNDPELVEWLLDHGAELNLQDALGDTPLNWATYYGHLDLVKLYVDKGADWSVASKQGTAVDIAMHRGHRDLVRFFIEEGAGDPIGTEAEALFTAIMEGDPEQVERLIEEGISPDQTDQLANPAITIAAEYGREEILNFLLREGADRDALNGVGESAMARAARFGHGDMVNRLLSVKADPNLAGAPFRITPLLAAAEAGHTAIIQELMASGAFPNAQEGINGYTPLMLATAGGHLEAVKALMAGGASPYLKSFEGAGLYDMLRYSNNPEIGKLIEEHLLED